MNNYQDALIKFNSQKQQINRIKTELLQSKGARDQLQKTFNSEILNYEKFKEDQKISYQASLFLMSEIVSRRKKATEAIEKMSTYALRLIYGKGYKLKFNTFEEKRKEGSNTFKMEIQIVRPFEGGEIYTGIKGERGGGVAEIVSFALRIAALSWMNYSGPLLLDEAYTSMSNDDKIHSVASFLRDVTDHTGRQIIFVTHEVDAFSRVADRVIEIKKVDGVAKAKILNKDLDTQESN